MEKVSIIIPIYNVEQYLSRSLDSVLSQTYQNIEVICINDCSTDSSLTILEQYKKLDNRIIIYNNTEHKTAADTRNFGIDISAGEYIMFVDGDDYIASNYVESMVKYLKKSGSDVLISDYYTLDFWKDEFDGKYWRYWQYIELPPETEVVSVDKNDGSNFLYFSVPCWNKAYSSKFLKSKNLKFPKIKIYEDIVFWGDVRLNAEKVAYTSNAYYYRKKRTGSLTTKRDEDVYLVITIHKMLADLFRKYNMYDKMKNVLDYIMLRDFLSKLSFFPEHLGKNLFNRIKEENYQMDFDGIKRF